jgi:hypothetical protein
MSAAMNGTIQSLRPLGDQCKVVACDFVSQYSDGPMATGSGLTGLSQFNPWIAAGVMICMGILFILVGFSLKHRNDPPEGDQKKKEGDP